ncbi:protein of unknown function DUF6 transmembrane [Methylobacterium sp. 4-46]|uniref:DMT family transporter n=1 Tax=unclassified Methylobacterium TaxID=2615210 RepID=UPI000152C03F|nr:MULTISPECIES: DMT family transporter [Methylobacterium]ACA19091.1 protein of unknown function DUF6 transmembrane [Methylobacterium sp. 4-46]WFT78303.1 DMT family transporter [Methylobacterium nodulans]
MSGDAGSLRDSGTDLCGADRILVNTDIHREGQPCVSLAPRAAAFAVLVAGGICLGTAPVVVKATGLPPEISAFYRVALAAPLFLAWSLAACAGRPPAPRAAGRPLAALTGLAAFLFAADLAVMHYAIGATNVAVATLFTNCAPFFVGLFGLIGLADAPTARFWQALPAALAGTALLIGLDGTNPAGGLAGSAAALLAGALYGGYLTVVKALRARGATPIRVMAAVSVGSTLLLLPLFWRQGMPVPNAVRVWLLLAVLVLFGQVAGQGLVTVALRHLPVALSSLVLLIQPVVAALLSRILLGETLSLIQASGIGLVLAAIALAAMPVRPRA